MTGSEGGFGERARQLLRDQPGVREAVTAATTTFDASRRAAWSGIDVEAWRDWAEGVKSHALGRLHEQLLEAEARLMARGARVHWAETREDALSILGAIVDGSSRDSGPASGGAPAGPPDGASTRASTGAAAGLPDGAFPPASTGAPHGAPTRPARVRVVKGKSMLSEELEVNPFLEARGAEVVETDLGEFIIQLLGEAPSHIVGPAIHRSLDDVRRLFADRFDTPPDASPEVLAGRARAILRDAFLTADVGITGANFLVAETGSLVVMENEGNIRLTTSLPRVHVALVGIEKVLPRWSDIAGFLRLTAGAATGQPVATYVSALQGPAAPGDPDGPETLHVILVDNGRSRLLADPEAWEALRCIRCGACLNVCPVFRQTGGHPYGWAYSGPIGAVLAPAFLGLEEGAELPNASTLCGACGDVCPVRIPLPRLLHLWRRRAVDAGVVSRAESVAVRAWSALATHPRLFHGAGELLAAVPPLTGSRSLPVVGAWVRERGPLEPSRPSFRRRQGSKAAAPDGVPDRYRQAHPDAGAGTDPPPEPPRSAGAASDHGDGSSGPRDPILARIRSALLDRAGTPHPGPFPGREDLPEESDLAERFTSVFEAAGGEVVRLEGAAASGWLESFAGDFSTVAVPRHLPQSYRPPLEGAAAERASLGVSRAVGAAADTGTLLLDGREGRRLQLLPPVHLVWLDERHLRPTLDEALDVARGGGLPRVLALHSGPSKSADIGRILVTGVHGPGRVVVALVSVPALDETEPPRDS